MQDNQNTQNNENILKEEKDYLVERIKSKTILFIIIIILYVGYKFYKGDLTIENFMNIKYDNYTIFNLKKLYELKSYIIFLLIMFPLSYMLWKSNVEWARKEIDKLDERLEKKKKEKEAKRQEEFERKMRGIHFRQS